jgi:GT2 family glycosyltransferase
VDWVSGACLCVRRDAFEAAGGLDEGFFLYWEDADFCRRLKHAGWRTVYVPMAGAVHVGGRSSRHAADASLEAFHRSAFRLYRKHAGRGAQLLAPLVYAGLRMRLAFMKRLVHSRRS